MDDEQPVVTEWFDERYWSGPTGLGGVPWGDLLADPLADWEDYKEAFRSLGSTLLGTGIAATETGRKMSDHSTGLAADIDAMSNAFSGHHIHLEILDEMSTFTSKQPKLRNSGPRPGSTFDRRGKRRY